MISCEECKGERVIYYDYYGSVIPLEYRRHILNRNRTYGVFGIFGHDLEDLVIEPMYYNRIKKRLTIYVGS